MKKPLLLIAGLAVFLAGRSQTTILSVGNSSALTIKNGTLFSADSLVLMPSADLTLANNNVKISHTALNIAPAATINRVYYLGSQISFTGTIQLYYQPSELNGNTESSLLYTDSANGSAWLASGSSTVNTSLHYVQQTASSRPFIGATASSNTVALALSLVSFTGVRLDNGITLQWTISQTQDMADFTVERSRDGLTWATVGAIGGQEGDGLLTYRYDDATPPEGALFYRLLIHKISGQDFYSGIVKLQATWASQIRLVTGDRAVMVYFTGTLPSGIRVVNAAGATVLIDRTSRNRYNVSGLVTGIYFLQYELNGQLTIRTFLIN